MTKTIEETEKECIDFMDKIVTDFKNEHEPLTEEEILQMIFDRR